MTVHVTDGRPRHRPMLYGSRDVALPIVCQGGRLLGALLLAALLPAACARSGLYPGELEPGELETAGANVGGSAAGSASMGGAPVTAPPRCEPSAEACNGRDDDCNGEVDDLAAEACAGGGFRYCVAGRLSQCPRRCEVCVPGSVRVCQNPFCSFWGEQECAADGQGFGPCREAFPPAECASTARQFEDSRELEECCLSNGYCCLDQFDVDGDGDRSEMLGVCGDVACD